MEKCKHCNGTGTMYDVCGHGDIRSNPCPYCRIAELEATLQTTITERDAAIQRRSELADEVYEQQKLIEMCQVKLAQVREWADMGGYLDDHGNSVFDPTEMGDLIHRILSSVPKPLAVVEHQVWCPDCQEVAYYTYNGHHEIGEDHLGTRMECDSKAIQPVTVIVLAAESEGGDD